MDGQMTSGEKEKTIDLFRHKPLEHPWQIRLVELIACKEEEDPVQCKIHLIPAGDAKEIDPDYDIVGDAKKIPYFALSYTWGDLNDKREILLNVKTFFVTVNLFAFSKWR